jgi:hypothetical protein
MTSPTDEIHQQPPGATTEVKKTAAGRTVPSDEFPIDLEQEAVSKRSVVAGSDAIIVKVIP